MKREFPDLNVDEERKRFDLYWSEGTRTLKRPKLAFRNWLVNARRFAAEKGGKGDGHGNHSFGKLPTHYETPEEYDERKWREFLEQNPDFQPGDPHASRNGEGTDPGNPSPGIS